MFNVADIKTPEVLQAAQAAYDANEYARLRAAEYALLNQDEMRFDDSQNNTTTWIDAIIAIKAKYPKAGV
jgi:hypothetical protein